MATQAELGNFDTVESFVVEDYLIRSLVRCQSCGQLYFQELIDCSNKFPQSEILIPVETRDEIEQLQRASPMELQAAVAERLAAGYQRAEDLPGA